LHWNPHEVPSHVEVPLSGTGQGRQLVPHDSALELLRQSPEQSCCPDGQLPEQAWPREMQAPKQRYLSDGQEPPQLAPSQVALPPAGTAHGVQLAPQVATSLSETHLPAQS
jgi:hypothetical protein